MASRVRPAVSLTAINRPRATDCTKEHVARPHPPFHPRLRVPS